MAERQEYSLKIDDEEARVVVEISGRWWRKKRKVEYYLPRKFEREAYSRLEKHVIEKLKKRPFDFHIHFHIGR